MHKISVVTFRVTSVLRFLCIPLYFLFDKLWRDSIPDTGFDLDLDFEFSFWEYLYMYGTVTILAVNTIMCLLISFKTRFFFSEWLKNKILLRVLYFGELIIWPFLAHLSYEHVKDVFFPSRSETNFLGIVLSELFPANTERNLYEKLMTIDFCIFTFCSLLFVLLFWKFYKIMYSRFFTA